MGHISGAALACVCFTLLLLPTAFSSNGAAGTDSTVNVIISFDPPKSDYCPEENFTILLTVTNILISDALKVVNVSVHFSWMPPGEHVWNDVSNGSSWLEPNGAGSETYALALAVPTDACSATYSYFFGIEYLRHTAIGDIAGSWGGGTTYRDFVVDAEQLGAETEGGSVNLTPYLAFIAVLLSLGAISAVMYYRHSTGEPGLTRVAGSGAAADEPYPVIRPLPGERFPVERGFLYLVKENRPRAAFTMFDEAVRHGAKGMLVAREHPDRLRKMHSFEAEVTLWLTRRTGVDHIDPTELSLLNLKITKFVEGAERAVVLIEGLEYTITQNDFESVLRFVDHLHDFVLTHDCAVILVIDPRVLSTRELALLERSAKIVEPFEEADQGGADAASEAEA
ncbi:MAG: DUF835 domain-containing protein [Methanobacteriota archaeon]|nr:MAG: DUF835 domain-containing protein [Euryarchaeota archaeon]